MSASLRTVSAQELALFTERIGRSLAERPLDIDVVEHRERVAALLREVGGASFYQLLAVGPTATPEKVHEGYERLARIVHPSHAPYLGLQGREDVLAVLFERATAAYITLSHPGRRRDYDSELGPNGWAPPEPGRSRAEENRDRARGLFNRATEFVAKEEYHFAIELMREAVRIDPQAKYFARLAELQEKNARWLHQAIDSYTRALELGGPDPQLEEALARLQRRMQSGGRLAGEGAPGDPYGDRQPTGAEAIPPATPHTGFGAGTSHGERAAERTEIEEALEPDGDDTQVDRWLHRNS
jgi:curved DNA-binding protein CbpA